MNPYVREVVGMVDLSEQINKAIAREAKNGHTLQTIVPMTENRVLLVFKP